MAAPQDLSSYDWVTDLDLLYEQLEAGFVDRSTVDGFVTSECAEDVYRGLNQFHYWTRRLQACNNVSVNTITFLGPGGLLKPDVGAIHGIIYEALGPGSIVEVNFPENTNFVSFLMVSPEAAKKMRELIVKVGGSLVCYVSAKPLNSFKVKILWAPLLCTIDNLVKALEPWCAASTLKFDQLFFKNGEVVLTNRASGVIILREGITLSSLPHVLRLPDIDKSYILLVIRERPPLCLRCRVVGHMRSQCFNVKCQKCGTLHARGNACPVKSYATVTKSSIGTASCNSHVSNDFTITPLPVDVEDGPPASGISALPTHRTGDPDVMSSPSQSNTAGEQPELGGFQMVSRRITRSMIEKSSDSQLVGLSDTIGVSLSVPSVFNILTDEMDATDVEVENGGVSLNSCPKPASGDASFPSVSDGAKRKGINGGASEGGISPHTMKRAKSSCDKEEVINADAGEVGVIPTGDWATEMEGIFQAEVAKKSPTDSLASVSNIAHQILPAEDPDIEEDIFTSEVEEEDDEEESRCTVVRFSGFSRRHFSSCIPEFIGTADPGRIYFTKLSNGRRSGIYWVYVREQSCVEASLKLDGSTYHGRKISVCLSECGE